METQKELSVTKGIFGSVELPFKQLQIPKTITRARKVFILSASQASV